MALFYRYLSEALCLVLRFVFGEHFFFLSCGGGVRRIQGLITGIGNSLGRLVQSRGLLSKFFFFKREKKERRRFC